MLLSELQGNAKEAREALSEAGKLYPRYPVAGRTAYPGEVGYQQSSNVSVIQARATTVIALELAIANRITVLEKIGTHAAQLEFENAWKEEVEP